MTNEIQQTPLYLAAKEFHDTYCANCPDHSCALGDALADIHRNVLQATHEEFAKLTPAPFYLKEPEPEKFVAIGHAKYRGRNFYGDHADAMAELHYLQDWKLWAEQRLRGFKTIAAFLKSIGEL